MSFPQDIFIWLIAALGALLIGLGKGGLPGIGNISIAIYALIFPAKLSVGILLPILIVADIVAVYLYRSTQAQVHTACWLVVQESVAAWLQW